MVASHILCAIAVLAAAAHAANSAGCGKAPPISAGKTSSMSGTFDGIERTWLAYLPANYDPARAYPLVVSTHGWGGDGAEDEDDSGLSLTSAAGGDFIAIFPDGLDDNAQKGAWGSWNCAGTILSPGAAGQTCTSWADPSNAYCYESCGGKSGCKGAGGCDWTTCRSDMTPSGIGTSDVTGFIPQLYNYVESAFCVDTTREYHSGMSNGAMFTYQTGVSMASRVAAIVPVAGSFHRGFLQAPATKVPLLDLHGTKDQEVPANATLSQDGWYFELLTDIVSGWKSANGCPSTSLRPYKPAGVTASIASKYKLTCVDHGCDTITCAWDGSHLYFGGEGRQWGGGIDNGNLVWGFLSQFTKESHAGFGHIIEPANGHGVKSTAPLKSLPRDVKVHREFAPAQARNTARDSRYRSNRDDRRPVPRNADELAFTTGDDFQPTKPVALSASVPNGTAAHYADPAGGCRSDEDVITLGTASTELGRLCAPKKTHVGASGTANGNDTAPCTVGGVSPYDNGCPTDTPGPQRGHRAAWPVCLSHPVAGKDFHCFLVCDPCRVGNSECSQEAHDMCPKGARCQVGYMKNMRQGICVYDS